MQGTFVLLNNKLMSMTDNDAIKGLDVREDGVYMTYVPAVGADPVSKKLGSVTVVNLAVALGNASYTTTKDYPVVFLVSCGFALSSQVKAIVSFPNCQYLHCENPGTAGGRFHQHVLAYALDVPAGTTISATNTGGNGFTAIFAVE